MAQPSQEINKLRMIVTNLSDAQAAAGTQLRFIELLGGPEFVAKYLRDEQGEPTTDITLEEFVGGMSALAHILGSITPEQSAAVAKLRL